MDHHVKVRVALGISGIVAVVQIANAGAIDMPQAGAGANLTAVSSASSDTGAVLPQILQHHTVTDALCVSEPLPRKPGTTQRST